MRHCFVGFFLAFCVVCVLATLSFAQDEEPIFSSDEALPALSASGETSSPTNPATAYWKITATMTLTAAAPGSHVQMLLPLSDGRQSVLSRHTSADGVNYREEADGLNLWGHWQVNGASEAKRQIRYEYTVQIADARTTMPPVPFPLKRIAPKFKPYLSPSPLIQSDATTVHARAQRLVLGSKQADRAVWALYQHVAAFTALDAAHDKSDALAVITAGRGSRFGKTRALVALLRAAGIPARVVGGIRLGDTPRKRTTISWAEALVGDTWVPLDPTGGYFAWLPNTYLALYRNDLPLLIHTRQVPVEYTFFIRQLTRTAALATDRAEGDSQGKRAKHALHYESEHVHTVAAYVDRPLASVVLINDEAIPQKVAEQILSAAREAQINIALLSADFESSYFREHYLQSLVSNNLSLLREADLLLINTEDTTGLYALLKQGELGVKLDGLHIVIAGGFARPVGRVLGAVLFRVLQPTEIVMIKQQPELTRLWEIARSHLRDGLSLAESSAHCDTQAVTVNAETLSGLGWWRHGLVRLWALAVQTQVPLPSLNLILVLPLIAFFLLIIRNVIGLETFGTFTPMLLSLAFLTTGLGWGLVVFVIIVGLGSGLRLALQRLRLHLVSRIAILIAVVAMSMAGLTVLGATLGIGALLHASIFPMVIMANQIESFTNTQLELGTAEALRLTLSTLLVATCSYVGIEDTGLKPLVLTFPEILFAVIAIELLLGRWRGLRLVEYLRFYDLLRQEAVSFQPPAFSQNTTTLEATPVAKPQARR